MFKLKVYLPGLKQDIFVKELSYKPYRNLVKSLYSGDKAKTIEQFNLILEEIAPDVTGKDITLIDKLAIFLTIREICVSPDLNLKCTCTESNSDFTQTFSLNTLQDLLSQVITEITVKCKNFTLVLDTCAKVKDEALLIGVDDVTFHTASKLKTLITDHPTDLTSLTLKDRVTVLSQISIEDLDLIIKELKRAKEHNSNIKLINIDSPFVHKNIYSLNGDLTPSSLNELLEYLFTEELNNVYKAMYNMVTHCKFSAEYIDSITPAEIQVYWGYYMEDSKRKNQNSNNSSSSPGFNAPSSPNRELGFG